MTTDRLYLALLLAIAFIFPAGYVSGQGKLDHEIFLERLKNSNNSIYKECIREYDTYLNQHPEDVKVMIEKCKFIQFAQYDEEEEYNPNQEQFDICSSDLIKRFPSHPEVLLFQMSYLWGDDLEDVFEKAEKAIEENPGEWDDASLAEYYEERAVQYYYDSENNLAYSSFKQAIQYNEQCAYSLDYARLLIEMDKKDEALEALTSVGDTTKIAWQLMQRADMLLELKAYSEALDIYDQIEQTDSAYIDYQNLAATLEGMGQYDLAREYLVTDTSEYWDSQAALRALLKHDLKYSDGATCIGTYNKFRDTGFLSDPLAFYRLRLLLVHPFLPWKIRDIAGLLSLLLLMAVLTLLPYIWILPVYFIGQQRKKPLNLNSGTPIWGLRTFWFVSAGYLIATLLSYIVEPEALYSYVNQSYFDFDTEVTGDIRGLFSLVFIIVMAICGFASMYKVNPKVLLSEIWSPGKSIITGFGIFFIFRVLTGIYLLIVTKTFDISIDNLAHIPGVLLATRQDIDSVICAVGKIPALLLLGLLVPVYEEIIFRGVILDSCKRHVNFTVANIIQSSLFSMMHMSLVLFPVFILFGMLTGHMRKKSGGLLPGIVFHSFNNTLILLVLFFR